MMMWLNRVGSRVVATLTGWRDQALGYPTRRWRAGWRGGYVTAVNVVLDPIQLREQLRVAMNAAVNEEYGRGVDPLPPYGVNDGPDHARLTIIAGKLAVLLTQVAADRGEPPT